MRYFSFRKKDVHVQFRTQQDQEVYKALGSVGFILVKFKNCYIVLIIVILLLCSFINCIQLVLTVSQTVVISIQVRSQAGSSQFAAMRNRFSYRRQSAQPAQPQSRQSCQLLLACSQTQNDNNNTLFSRLLHSDWLERTKSSAVIGQCRESCPLIGWCWEV